MADQIVLAWTVNVAGSPFGPVRADAALAAVPLYQNATTDPVLGQLFGLTVASDVTTHDAVSATRTLTLNMTRIPGAPFAPPPFPCHPDTTTPPVLPYVLRKAVTLPAVCTPTTGSLVVQTSASLIPSLSIGDKVQFLSQLGVFYAMAGVGSTTFTLGGVFTGRTGESAAVKMVPDPAARPALFSSSPLDTAGFATVPAIPAGSGARTVSITYTDSLGAGPFTIVCPLTGRRPAACPLAGGSIDIAVITAMHVASTGAFDNSVGQITLVDLSEPLPVPLTDATPADFLGPLTDEAQLLIDRAVAYLPPSYFALAQQNTSLPQLAGDFFVTTGSANVTTSKDQTGVLAPGSILQFASQNDASSIVQSLTPAGLVLTAPYLGLNLVNQRDSNGDKRSNDQTARAQLQATSAFLLNAAAAAPPSNPELAGGVAQYVNPGNAVPPPDAPFAPQTMTPSPTFLSGLFTQQLQLALAGVPVVPSTVAFL